MNHHSTYFLLSPMFACNWHTWFQYYYEHYQSKIMAFLACIGCLLAWSIFRLESPAWQQLRAEYPRLFPHLQHPKKNLFDVIRYVTQSLWLITIKPLRYTTHSHAVKKSVPSINFSRHWYKLQTHFQAQLDSFFTYLERKTPVLHHYRAAHIPIWVYCLFIIVAISISLILLLSLTQPFNLYAQFTFILLLFCVSTALHGTRGNLPVLILIMLSLTVSTRYLLWRYHATLNWDHTVSLMLGILLIVAETYGWIVLVLSYFQTLHPLNRQPESLPTDISQWPHIDVLIPTYNENLNVVAPAIYAVLALDWPSDKLHIYLLDDGNRPDVKAFADSVQINYLARPTHEHGKAGNLNYAMQYCHSDYMAIFDCDHITARSFLQLTMGLFLKDPKLALVQTPHHFFSPDPFERNLNIFKKSPNESALFYGLIQNGNDLWNATFFCGSCAVLKRHALDKIGGVAVETITEDAHTALKLHRSGYHSAYIRIPQAAGLATENLTDHIKQRMRWAQGMTQIMRLDNPMLGKGLSVPQRLCYLNAMLYFLSGIPRLIFLIAPLAFLLFNLYIIMAPGLLLLLYVIPHMIHAHTTNSRIQGRYRHTFWGEVYDTVLAWYIARPTMLAMLFPHKPAFKVTAKGNRIDQSYLNWNISIPYLIMAFLNVVGFLFGIWHLIASTNTVTTILINMGWAAYNIIIIGGAAAVAFEVRQIRESPRVDLDMAAIILCTNGHFYPCTLRNYSNTGVGIEIASNLLAPTDNVQIILPLGTEEYVFPTVVVRVKNHTNPDTQLVGLWLNQLTPEAHIQFIRCTFGRADNWVGWQQNAAQTKENPLRSFHEVVNFSLSGYRKIAKQSPLFVKESLLIFSWISAFFVSLLPHPVHEKSHS